MDLRQLETYKTVARDLHAPVRSCPFPTRPAAGRSSCSKKNWEAPLGGTVLLHSLKQPVHIAIIPNLGFPFGQSDVVHVSERAFKAVLDPQNAAVIRELVGNPGQILQ